LLGKGLRVSAPLVAGLLLARRGKSVSRNEPAAGVKILLPVANVAAGREIRPCRRNFRCKDNAEMLILTVRVSREA